MSLVSRIFDTMRNLKANTIVILLTTLINNVSAISPIVETSIGRIHGLRASDGEYLMFMGIPYATVNESNPFGPSTPHSGFETTFEAYRDSVKCPQLEPLSNTIVGALDCLHINVYVPNTGKSKTPLPVMVWIYGGGSSIGSSSRLTYGPRYLVKQDVILVTFNYRLGPYGFMCLGTSDIPGNQGLKDQLLALRWVKNHIDSFGGDTNKITIFGESAGAASVDFHLIYGREKLFDKVIMQSGVALAPWSVLEPNTGAPLKLAKHLGLSTLNINEALKFISRSDPKLVISSTSELKLMFKPCVEKGDDNLEKFIYDHPINIKNLNLRNMTALIGYNSNEMIYHYEHKTHEEYVASNVFYNTLKDNFNFSKEYLNEMETQIRQFYIGDEEFSIDVKEEIVEFSSDFNFNYPVVRTINKYLDSGTHNLYFHLFSYDGDRAFMKRRINITTSGVAHGDELGYIFDSALLNQSPTFKDQLTIDRVTTMWANFAKYGKPILEVSEHLPAQWPAATKNKLYYLNIDSELKVQKRNLKSRMALWNLFYKINAKHELAYQDPDK